jgi:hypothetical protein
MGRLPHCMILVVLSLVCAGCAASGPSKGLSLPLIKNAKDEALRKQVEADSFPSAQQVGLKSPTT